MKKSEKTPKLQETYDVGILVPCNGTWVMQFGAALVGMVQHTMTWRPDPSLGIKSMRVRLYTLESSMLVQNRQKLVAHAMKDGCTHMLFLDSDMIFPKDTLIRLLQRGKQVVGANYMTRSFPTHPVALGRDGKHLSSKGKVGLQKVNFLGLGVTLIAREAIEKLSVPLFMMEWIPDISGFCGEDVYFCAKLTEEAGADVYVDHDLSNEVLHVGKTKFGFHLEGHELPGNKDD